MRAAVFLFSVGMLWAVGAGAWEVTDAGGTHVQGKSPVQRIVTLSPALAELVFAAGAGHLLVGTTAKSDYPPAARKVPRVGSYNALSPEAILKARPDVVLAWGSGTPKRMIARLRGLGLKVVVMHTEKLTGIARHLRMVGQMAGTEKTADTAARHFLQGLAQLRKRSVDAPKLRVFYQISLKPLYTVGGKHYISQAIGLCGGSNVFSELDIPAPRVATEAVLKADPQVILFGRRGNDTEIHDYWQQFSGLSAVRHDNVLAINAWVLSRATPRMLSAVQQLCSSLEGARERINASR